MILSQCINDNIPKEKRQAKTRRKDAVFKNIQTRRNNAILKQDGSTQFLNTAKPEGRTPLEKKMERRMPPTQNVFSNISAKYITQYHIFRNNEVRMIQKTPNMRSR